MPPLSNGRHELFAQGLAMGKTADQAYQDAGYVANRGNAATLKANQSILDRKAELQGKARERTETTVATLTEAFWETFQDNKSADGNQSARVAALNGLMKMHGLEADPRKNDSDPVNVNVNGFPDLKKKLNGHTNGHARHHDPE